MTAAFNQGCSSASWAFILRSGGYTRNLCTKSRAESKGSEGGKCDTSSSSFGRMESSVEKEGKLGRSLARLVGFASKKVSFVAFGRSLKYYIYAKHGSVGNIAARTGHNASFGVPRILNILHARPIEPFSASKRVFLDHTPRCEADADRLMNGGGSTGCSVSD